MAYLCHHLGQLPNSNLIVRIPNIEDVTIGSSRIFLFIIGSRKTGVQSVN